VTSERKDRLIQARVPEKLEATLKNEARRRRTTVSQMIRAILQDTFQLVDDVVANVDLIVSDSVDLAQRVGRDARLRGRGAHPLSAGSEAACHEPLPDAADRLSPVQAWNEVVLNQPVACTKCGAKLSRGCRAYLGLCEDPSRPRAWLCAPAVEALANRPAGRIPDEPAHKPEYGEET